jgi:transposase
MNEQERRIEAIRRVKQGEHVNDVCETLGRSRPWYYKWSAVFETEGVDGLIDGRCRNEPAAKTPQWLADLIVSTRDQLVQKAQTGKSFVGIGARQVVQELIKLEVDHVPHWATVHRILHQAGRIPVEQEGKPEGYCLRPKPKAVNSVHQIDIWPRVISGGEYIYFFHLVDVASWYPFGKVYADKSTNTALSFLIDAWKTVGLPIIAQFDNEMSFSGGRWSHRLGRVVRLCLALGIQVWFIPFYTPERNGFVESFHGQCDLFFWSRHAFETLSEVQADYPAFLKAFRHDHHLPAIANQTPAAFRSQNKLCLRCLPEDFALAKPRQLPLVSGIINCVRLADTQGTVNVLNHHLELGEAYARHYILAKIQTARQKMTLYHQPDAKAALKEIDVYPFPLPESAVACDPTFSYLLADSSDC